MWSATESIAHPARPPTKFPRVRSKNKPGTLSASANAYSSTGECLCQCIFVDVGLNNGDTLTSWPKVAVQAMGRAQPINDARDAYPVLRHAEMASCLKPTNRHKACYFGFEANPSFTERLQALERQLRRAGVCVQLYTSTAFGTTNGHANLHVDSITKGSTGSTLDPQKPVVGPRMIPALKLTNSTGRYGGATPEQRKEMEQAALHLSYSAVQQVATRDGAEFLHSLRSLQTPRRHHPPFVAVKLDIEGFEYTLLPYLLRRRAIAPVHVLAVEWHEKTGAPAYQGRTWALMKALEKSGNGTVVLPWK